MKDDQEQCRRAGANDYLAKPIDLDRLFSLLRVWMPSIERLVMRTCGATLALAPSLPVARIAP